MKVAVLLKPYGIKSNKQRVGEEQLRGYKRAAFEDAWERYTRADPPAAEVRAVPSRPKPHGYAENAGSSSRPRDGFGTACEESANPHGCNDGTAWDGLERQNGREPADDALTLDQVLTGNGAAYWLAAHDLEDIADVRIPRAVPVEVQTPQERAEVARLLDEHADPADGDPR
jgi:hypothetical protein